MKLKKYSKLPFKLVEISETEQVRLFSAKEKTDEMDWHRDREDREVTPVSGSGWMLQLDNQLPISLDKTQSYFVPKGVWHRVIKTSNADDLLVRIKLLV